MEVSGLYLGINASTHVRKRFYRRGNKQVNHFFKSHTGRSQDFSPVAEGSEQVRVQEMQVRTQWGVVCDREAGTHRFPQLDFPMDGPSCQPLLELLTNRARVRSWTGAAGDPGDPQQGKGKPRGPELSSQVSQLSELHWTQI